MKNIKQSVINTFVRCGIPYEDLDNDTKNIVTRNRFTGEPVEVTELVAYLISWVYNTGDQMELGGGEHVRIDDFDRIRYFVLDQDQHAYNICLD